MADFAPQALHYFPALRTRQAEMRALEELDATRKSQIAPVVTLGKWPRASDFLRSAERAVEAMKGGSFFMDLTHETRHLAEEQAHLNQPDNGFANWRSFVRAHRGAFPVVRTGTGVRVRDVSQQAREIERSYKWTAFRIRDFSVDVPLTISAISAMDDPKNAIVFLDAGYIRNAFMAYVTASIAVINQIRTEISDAFIVILSTSYPASTSPFVDATGTSGTIDILERELFSRIGGSDVAVYGDHASIHSVVYDDAAIMRWIPRIDYPHELDWSFQRRPGESGEEAWISAAARLVQLEPDIGTHGLWGEQMIVNAAKREVFGKAPASWIAVRANIHMARQIDFSTRLAEDGDEQDDAEA